MDEPTEKSIQKIIKYHAKGLDIPPGAAESFIEASIKSAKKSFKGKTIITEQDLKRALKKELKKYNRDLAYVYENYDIII